jgi:cytochrome c peroxidase
MQKQFLLPLKVVLQTNFNFKKNNIMNKITYLIMMLFVLVSCTPEIKPKKETPKFEDLKLFSAASKLFQPITNYVDSSKNNFTPAKVELGKTLYYDTKLSPKGNNSCNSCHNLSTFGVDQLSFSPGDEGKLGGRNSPTTLNASLHTMQFWDGRAKDVEEQAGMPILNPVEMNIPNEQFLLDRLSKIDYYQKLFKDAFPNESNPITYTNIRLAIAAFERTLLTPSAFDNFLNENDNALTAQQKRGLEVFINTGCATCHNGIALGGNSFQKFGAISDFRTLTKSKNADNGLFDITKNELDKDNFKVPSLRNIEHTYPYFHDGSVKDLKEAIKIMAKVQLNKTLAQSELDDIESFLKSLTGEVSAYAKTPPSILGADATPKNKRK